MVKNSLLTLVILLLVQPLMANMAAPVQPGESGATPFTAEKVDILHERVKISIDDAFESARMEIEYKINVMESGEQIPLVFYAPGYREEFSVLLNGDEVSTLTARDDDKQETILERFAESFDDEYIEIVWAQNDREWYHIDELVFFEADLDEGEHTVQVSYYAQPWINSLRSVKQYAFRYSLSPAEHWKSFGTLDVELDLSRFAHPVSTNLDSFDKAEENGVIRWSFNELPASYIEIHYQPEISAFAEWMIGIGPDMIAVVIIILLTILHLLFISLAAGKSRTIFNWVLISGIIIIPFLITLSYSLALGMIDAAIGVHASGRHGMFIVLIMAYPVVLVIYGLIIWLISRKIRKKATMKKSAFIPPE